MNSIFNIIKIPDHYYLDGINYKLIDNTIDLDITTVRPVVIYDIKHIILLACKDTL